MANSSPLQFLNQPRGNIANWPHSGYPRAGFCGFSSANLASGSEDVTPVRLLSRSPFFQTHYIAHRILSPLSVSQTDNGSGANGNVTKRIWQA